MSQISESQRGHLLNNNNKKLFFVLEKIKQKRKDAGGNQESEIGP